MSASSAAVAEGAEDVAEDSVEAGQAAFGSPVDVAPPPEPRPAPPPAPSLHSEAVPVPVSSGASASLAFHRLQKQRKKRTLKGCSSRMFHAL